jgi:PhnB protein
MAVDVFINFNGTCRNAVEFYAKVFNAEKPKFMTFGDTPESPEFPLTEEAKNLIMYTYLNINGSNVMFSDIPPSMTFIEGNNISLIIGSTDLDEIKSLFDKLKEGGSVDMELQETFWSKCYGSLTDKFGIRWQLSYSSGETEK